MKQINTEIEHYKKVQMNLKSGEKVIFKILNAKEVSEIMPYVSFLSEAKDINEEFINTFNKLWNILVIEHDLGELESIPIFQLQQILEVIIDNQTIKKKIEKSS